MPSIMHMINVIGRCQDTFRADNAISDDLSTCHHSFIYAISKNPGLTQDQLAKKLCLNKSTVARTVIYLEEHGYVRREQNISDKRAILIYPTEKMVLALQSVRNIDSMWRSFLLSDFSDGELSDFTKTLEKLCEKAKSYVTGEEEGSL